MAWHTLTHLGDALWRTERPAGRQKSNTWPDSTAAEQRLP
jgi:hypothetical protein